MKNNQQIMRWGILLLCGFVVALTLQIACRRNIGNAITAQAGDSRGVIESGGLKRTFVLHLPAQKNDAMPLLIVLHGGSGQGAGISKLTRFNERADRDGYLVVYPDGVERNWNDGRLTVRRKDVDDVKFIADLIDYIASNHSVDRQRVYVTGISNGGMMSFRLACELSDKIAAIAVVAASMPAIMPARCNPARAVPVVMLSGTDDPIMPFNGGDIGTFGGKGLGGKVTSVKESVDFWVKQNRTKVKPDVTELPDKDSQDGTRVRREIYAQAVQNSEVVLYTINGGGHTWPGGAAYLPEKIIGRVTQDINGSDLVQEFLFRHKILPRTKR